MEGICPYCKKIVTDDQTIQEKDGVVYHAACKDRLDAAIRNQRKVNPLIKDASPLPSKIAAPITASEDPRHKQHGTFAVRSELAQALKARMRDAYGGRLAMDQRQALDEIAGKLSRICCGDPDDPEHWDDVAGYAKLVADRLKGVRR